MLATADRRHEFELPFPSSGAPVSVYVNPRLIADAFSACRASAIRFGFAGALAQIVIQPYEPNGFMAVVMPMKPPA